MTIEVEKKDHIATITFNRPRPVTPWTWNT